MDAIKQTELRHQVALDRPGNEFQRRARLLQALWREQQGFPIGVPLQGPPRPLGSMLATPWAEETYGNFLTTTIADVVRSQVPAEATRGGPVYMRPRLFRNLLSSQPMCFNLFGELQRDLPLATSVLGDVTSGRVAEVTGIQFEYSPGRGNPEYTDDGSAFDVFVTFITPQGSRGFLGIEVKYHEDLKGGRDRYRERYDEVAAEMECFAADRLRELRSAPLEQIWRDHLLAGATKCRDGYAEGLFVFLRPDGNAHCARAVSDYRACLTSEATFVEWGLEDVVAALRRHTDAGWVSAFADRYLDFGKVDAELAAAGAIGG